jgi:membrane protein implicated in regulation of membrane protease activity
MSQVLFGDSAAWFTVPAIIGTAFFTLRIVMLMLGAGAHDLGLDVHGDFHAGDAGHGADIQGDAHHADATHGFNVLSTQSIAAMAMGFGWGGFAALRSGWSWPGVIASGVVCAAVMVWVLAMLLRGMTELQTSGNIPIGAALGHEGDVYVKVPGGSVGRGQVKVTVSQHQRIYNAVTGGEDLPSGTRVRVVKVNDDNTLTVARA